MRKQRLTAVIICGFGLFMTAPTFADDWPQWRGADGTGVSTETQWVSQGKSESLWTKNVGVGYTSFVIHGDRMITSGHDVEKELDTIYCFEAQTGKEIWRHSFPSQLWKRSHVGGTLSTPTIDGDHVYALNREGRLMCLQLISGVVVWEKQLKEEYDLEYPTWMFSTSPLVQDDMLIVNVGRTLAFSKDTGELIWQSENSGHAYSTPHPMKFNGRDCVVVFNSIGLYVYDRSTGEELGNHGWVTQYDINAATPIIIDDRIFISSGQNRGCAMLEMTSEGLKVVWENKEMSNKMSGCVLWEEHLYGFDAAILKCLDLDGNEQWSKRGLGMGSLMVAGGRLIVNSSKGELIITDASPGGYSEQSRTKVLEGGVYWTMPVIANGLIYCRNSLGDVVCRDHRVSSN